MGLIAGIVGIVGLGAQVGGQIAAANAQADASRKAAAIKNAQADEILSREAINAGILKTQESRSEDLYTSGFASTGRGGAGGLGGVMRMRSDFAITLANNQRDATFKAQMLRQGADIDMTLASDSEVAGYLGAAATAMKGGADVYSLYKKNSSTTSLFADAAGDNFSSGSTGTSVLGKAGGWPGSTVTAGMP